MKIVITQISVNFETNKKLGSISLKYFGMKFQTAELFNKTTQLETKCL